MQIALINQFFWPDSAATSQILTDAARELADLNCQVTALCGGNEYAPPASKSRPEARIIRTHNFGFGHNRATRMASYLWFLAGTLYHGLRLTNHQSVVTLTTPPLLSVIGSIVKVVRGSRHYIWEMDVYPDIATELGAIRRGGLVASAASYLAHWSRRSADAIIVLGEEMKTRLVSQGIPAAKIHICENWADGREITPHAFPHGPLTVYYSGNLGLAHDVETIRIAMLHFRHDPDIRFVFAGGGPRRPPLEAFCREHDINNASFRPYCARETLGESLAEGHLGLITQLPQTLGCIVPSKAYGIMGAGRPLLYIGPKAATPARHIARYDCGWQIDPGDVDSLIGLLAYLRNDRQPLQEAGRRARSAFETNFDLPIGIARVCRVLGIEVPVPEEKAFTAAGGR